MSRGPSPSSALASFVELDTGQLPDGPAHIPVGRDANAQVWLDRRLVSPAEAETRRELASCGLPPGRQNVSCLKQVRHLVTSRRQERCRSVTFELAPQTLERPGPSWPDAADRHVERRGDLHI